MSEHNVSGTTARRYVIIGGDAAGMSAATQIRRLDPEGSITVLEKTTHISYAQCGLPYWVSGVVPSGDKLVARTKEAFQEQYAIDVHLEEEAISIDPEQKTVTARRKDGTEHLYAYDRLLIATGARAVLPPWADLSLDGVYALKTMDDADRLIQGLKNHPVENVVIIGGGYIGLEMVEAFYHLGKKVTLLDLAPHVALTFDPEMAQIVQAGLQEKGIHLALGEEVVRLDSEARVVRSVETKHHTYPADLVLIAIGVVPNSELAKAIGARLGPKGAIWVDQTMQTSIPDIYAAGDCATQYHRIKKEDDFVPLGTHANKQGRTAGTNMAGGRAVFTGIVGSAIMKVLDVTMGRTGLNEREAKALGLIYDTVTIRARSHAHYYPDAKTLHIKLLYERESRKLLGGQIIGQDGVDKRIDVLATALFNEMTLEALQGLDLSYAPPYNSVWDPLQQAATVALKQ
ncbi:MAG: NADH dehydrogenase [Candidatus Carbobacillus altaicus]|uniref:NADH dehydrogenase n=1 Tax=Candidatus Carbonibacillus altaicus TaxID=2163959 RepID=A0A2R6Y3H6_9BACL|nr:MAG: NADH dehydrogenase [Candidatus Carbobacillus altaicus]